MRHPLSTGLFSAKNIQPMRGSNQRSTVCQADALATEQRDSKTIITIHKQKIIHQRKIVINLVNVQKPIREMAIFMYIFISHISLSLSAEFFPLLCHFTLSLFLLTYLPPSSRFCKKALHKLSSVYSQIVQSKTQRLNNARAFSYFNTIKRPTISTNYYHL